MSIAFCPGVSMAKEPTSLSVRVATDLIQMARVICALASKGKPHAQKQTEYIDSILRPRIIRDYEAAMTKMKKADD